MVSILIAKSLKAVYVKSLIKATNEIDQISLNQKALLLKNIGNQNTYNTSPFSANNTVFKIISFSLAWSENPTVSIVETISHPIDKVEFPTITLCPENFNPQRFGPAIQVLDYFQWKCSDDR